MLDLNPVTKRRGFVFLEPNIENSSKRENHLRLPGFLLQSGGKEGTSPGWVEKKNKIGPGESVISLRQLFVSSYSMWNLSDSSGSWGRAAATVCGGWRRDRRGVSHPRLVLSTIKIVLVWKTSCSAT